MTDWKDALSALTGTPRPETETPKASPDVTRRKRDGVVYSTNPHYEFAAENAAEPKTIEPSKQQLRVSMERAGRGGKTVTLVRGFIGTDADLQSLARTLRQRCGTGGSEKDGEIIIQGDRRTQLVSLLRDLGYTRTK